MRGLSSLQLPVRAPTIMSPRAEDCQPPAEVCCVLPGPQSLRAWTWHKAHLSRISYCLMERRAAGLIHTRANGPLPMTVWKAGRHAAFVGLSAKGRGLMAHSLRARLNQAEALFRKKSFTEHLDTSKSCFSGHVAKGSVSLLWPLLLVSCLSPF